MIIPPVKSILFLGLSSVLIPVPDCPSSSQDGYTASSSQYIFNLFQPTSLALWDGPLTYSAAPMTSSTVFFPLPEILYYNYFAASVYCTDSLDNLSCCYCSKFNSSVSRHEIFENSAYGTKVLLTVHPSKTEIVVTFRGSLTFTSWVTDTLLLQVTPKSGSSAGVKIHRGNHLQLMSIYNLIVKEVGILLTQNPSYRLVITGHSMGGAMASLFTFFILSLYQFPGTNVALVTFGQPRTGNKEYASYMNSLPIPMARVVALADIVPHAVPVSAFGALPALFGIYYLHHGQEVWINGNVTKFCSKTVYEDPTCSNSMGPLYSVLDHDQYFDADYAVCFTKGQLDFFTLPGFIPSTYIPPMPSRIENFFLPIIVGGYEGLLPIVG